MKKTEHQEGQDSSTKYHMWENVMNVGNYNNN